MAIQNSLLGSKLSCDRLPSGAAAFSNAAVPSTDQGDIAVAAAYGSEWFFHSPLLYWNCSIPEGITESQIVQDINKRSGGKSPVNVTLRYSSVFAGKQFTGNELAAADAVVISLFYKLDSKMGRIWQERAEDLARAAGDRWDVYPLDGNVRRSRLFEFRFQPMSLQENVSLGLAYGLMALYVAASLRKLRAVKSKIGLIITVITQVGTS
jgi:hypothetical protein